MSNIPCVYAVGGPSVAVTIEVETNATTSIPVLDDGTRAHWIVCTKLVNGDIWVKTGAASDVMSAIGEGLALSRRSDMVLDVPRGHTNIHIFGEEVATIVVTPLSERPGR